MSTTNREEEEFSQADEILRATYPSSIHNNNCTFVSMHDATSSGANGSEVYWEDSTLFRVRSFQIDRPLGKCEVNR